MLIWISQLARKDCFVHPMNTSTQEQVNIHPGYGGVMIWFVNFPERVPSLMFHEISAADTMIHDAIC